MAVFSSLVIILIVIIYWKWIYVPRRIFTLLKNVPGPKAYPIIASLPFIISENWKVFNSEELLTRFMSASVEFGGVFPLWFANEPIVTITKGEYVEALLSTNKHLDKADEYHLLNPSIGKNCLLTMKGDVWRPRYKLLSPAVSHTEVLKTMMMSINKQSNTLVEILNEKLENCNGKTLEINLESYVSKCILDVVVEAGAGKDMKLQTDASYTDEYEKVEGASFFVFERLFKPWLRANFIWKLLPNGKKEHDYMKLARKYTKPVLDEKFKAKIEAIKNGEIALEAQIENKNVSFIDRILTIFGQKNALDYNVLYEEITLLINASHDTTSACLYFTIYLLAVNPDYQKLVYEELFGIFGSEKNPEFDKSHLSQMKYMEMCIKESLRIFPTIPLIARKLSSDLDLGDGKILPAGITVAIITYILHRDPEIFDNPEEFRPDRWSSENCVGRSQYAYIPFSIGPRNCLGQRHAMSAIKIGLGKLLLNFSVGSDIKREDIIVTPNVVLKSKIPIICKLTKRD